MAQKTLNEDLNVLSNSDLEITYLNGDLNIIQKLDDEPNDVGGLTSAELKAKFDEAGNIIKDYINETLIPELLASDATEAEREAAESARETAETARAAAEESRATAESGRATAEAARVLAENARAAAETQRATAETARAEAETARASEFAALKSAAEQATEDADSAALAVQNMTVSAQTLTAGSAATVSKGTNDNGGISLAFGIPKGEKGEKGDKGDKGEPGKDGSGSGDMSASDYDPNSVVKAGGGIPAYVTAQTAAMTTHIADRNNPHGVTAAQVGARPDTWTPTAAQVGAPMSYYKVFSEENWTDGLLTIPLSEHGLVNIKSGVVCQISVLSDGVLRGGTWASLETYATVDPDKSIVLHHPSGGYSGAAILIG